MDDPDVPVGKNKKTMEVMTMKKRVLAMVVLGMIAMFGCKEVRGEEQEFKWPGWGCTDVAVLQEQLALAENDWEKIPMTYLITFAGQAPASFAAACAVIEEAINAINPGTAAERRLDYKKQYAYCTGQWPVELMAYCKANPNSYDYHVAMKDTTEWGFQRISELLLQYAYSPVYVLDAIKYLNRQGISLDKSDEEMSLLFKKLNRVYSARLEEDQPSWEKVVAMIRQLQSLTEK